MIDASRVTYDFTTSFPDISAPATTGLTSSYTISAITSSTTFPRVGDTASADGTYYYYVPSASLNGHDTISITAGRSVVITFTNTTGTVLQTTGNAEIDIPANANLTIYAAGDIQIAGNGLLNGSTSTPNQPKNVQIYGTRSANTAASSGMQDIQIAGNGYLSAVTYTPNANVRINGNGETYGAVIANQVTMVGNANFHYDESLANLSASNIYGLTKWRELSTTADRAVYDTQLNF